MRKVSSQSINCCHPRLSPGVGEPCNHLSSRPQHHYGWHASRCIPLPQPDSASRAEPAVRQLLVALSVAGTAGTVQRVGASVSQHCTLTPTNAPSGWNPLSATHALPRSAAPVSTQLQSRFFIGLASPRSRGSLPLDAS